MSQIPMRRLLVIGRHTLSLYRFPWGWRLRHIVWSKNEPSQFRIAHQITFQKPNASQSPSEKGFR